ncbi:MAG TPA: SdrD B-like domain-containing protein [Gemmataceae bacterium]|nr:SdrD B-like domain-containing protein [Gemmataceae bacterium]
MKLSIPSLRLFRGLLRKENTVRRVARPAARSFRPCLEELEARWVPCVTSCGGAVCGGGGNTSITSNCNGGGCDNQGYTINCNGGGGCANQGYTNNFNGNNCGQGTSGQGNNCGQGSSGQGNNCGQGPSGQGNNCGQGWSSQGNGCGQGSSGQGNGCGQGGGAQSVTLSGVVYYDAAGQGNYSPSDTGLANVSVILTNASGTVVATTTTNSSGGFSFGIVPPGTYTITYAAASGYETEAEISPLPSGATATAGQVSNITVSTSNVTVDLPEVLSPAAPPAPPAAPPPS